MHRFAWGPASGGIGRHRFAAGPRVAGAEVLHGGYAHSHHCANRAMTSPAQRPSSGGGSAPGPTGGCGPQTSRGRAATRRSWPAAGCRQTGPGFAPAHPRLPPDRCQGSPVGSAAAAHRPAAASRWPNRFPVGQKRCWCVGANTPSHSPNKYCGAAPDRHHPAQWEGR